METELDRKIRAYVNGEAGADIFDARDRRHIRALLKEHHRKQKWLRDKLPCPRCHGEGWETVANPDDARSSRTDAAIDCRHACIVMGCAM
ncbi:hypothetical protein C7450_1341 [Chelatococcus asaccharovorans]|uniref:Uncharacterized protein n=1 Tax=Chelatococcus asaccharovorans TaxID=28210 RepID=A0A2V3TRK8_9HYPH|nr:hypothetical protein C7450_1341 [Chelatococcus asaccharovorans]